MADALKVLGQVLPASGTLTAAYTVPASVKAIVSTILMANLSMQPEKARVAIAVAGAADELKQYLYYDLPIPANDTLAATLGISLASTDVIRVQSAYGNIAFNIFGAEVV